MKGIVKRKFTNRLITILSFTVISLVILLIFHMNMCKQMSRAILVPLKSKNKSKLPNKKHNFIKNFETSKSKSIEKSIDITEPLSKAIDTFHDLYDAIDTSKSIQSGYSSSISSSDASFKIMSSPTFGELLKINITNKTTSLERFHMQITANEMYPVDSTVVGQLLSDMANLPIQKVDEMEGGTQFKLAITYRNGMKALFKPMRCERDEENPVNQIYFAEFERHNAEIAAFHVDRLLGFRRALPVIGRTLNVVTQIMQIGNEELKETFYTSPEPDTNICFTGNCKIYCDLLHPICAKGNQLEGSLMAFLPSDNLTLRQSDEHPYIRSYNEHETEEWRTNPNYCENIKEMYPMQSGRHLLDFMDTAILDFLIGHCDRHNYQTFRIFEHAFHMHYDHGKSFGRPFYDDYSILTPISQCCVVRASTLKTLLSYHHGPKSLSTAVRESMENDPVAPILTEPHLAALDRRVEAILKQIRKCLEKNSIKHVIVNS